MTIRPGPDEAAPYYFTYIDQTPEGDIVTLLERQGTETAMWLARLSAETSRWRPAPEKWTMRDVVAHLTDTERLFQARAFWFARGFDTPLPSFDQEVAAAAAGASDREWGTLVEELAHVRVSTVDFFKALPPHAWSRRGIASGHTFSVRALAYLTFGHMAHHLRIIREHYLES